MDAIKGINYVRPPTLDFKKIKDTSEYTEYEIKTKYLSDEIDYNESSFVNNLDSFIYCNSTMNIKIPKKKFMFKEGKPRFAYAFGMFPNPKTGMASYLDGCILGALGLKRQKTMAKVICFVTPDISSDDIRKLNIVFDEVKVVPYISPYKINDKADKGRIKMDKSIFKNCPNYDKNHPYSHVFFKLHVFNPELFPYDKVCFVDSDLVPLNYYDSLFTLNTPAGWVEYRKKEPYLEAFNWDRCDFLKHGDPIPKFITDIDKKSGADVNAGLFVISPNKKEYNQMIKELTSPVSKWMGKNKIHKGFWSFDFDSSTGSKFVENSYCYPEQNYLTKRYSGKWTYIEFAFQSWGLDPCNSFGIHMAAFNPKPWFKQPAKGLLVSDKNNQPYMLDDEFSKQRLVIAEAIRQHDTKNFENISFCYEIFNDLIIWGLVSYPELHKFFMDNAKIYGKKISFDVDQFERLSKEYEYQTFKDIDMNSNIFKNRLSLSQQYITRLIQDYNNTYSKIKDNYLSICKSKLKNKKGEFDYNFKIIDYPDYKTRDIVLPNKSKSKSKKTKSKSMKGGSVQLLVGLGSLVIMGLIGTGYLYNKIKNNNQKVNDNGLIKNRIKLYPEPGDSDDIVTQYEDKEAYDESMERLQKQQDKEQNRSAIPANIEDQMIYSGGKKKKSTKKKKPIKKKKIIKKKKNTKKKYKKQVEFYYVFMDGCPSCTNFEQSGTWDKIKKDLNNIKFKEINGPENPNFLHKNNINKFPSFMAKKGSNTYSYNDMDRSPEKLTEFINRY
jgi:hypothetical protein